MADVKVISVNPSVQTLGAINTAKLEDFARSLRMNEASVSFPGLEAVCRFIFGVNPIDSDRVSSKPVFVRIVTAALFAFSAYTASATFSTGLPFLTLALVISGMIAVGFFERIASFGGFAMLTGLIIYSIVNSSATVLTLESTETILFVMMAGTLLAASVMGPGAISIDRIMCRALYRSIKKHIAHHREQQALHEAEIRLSYKAWRNA